MLANAQETGEQVRGSYRLVRRLGAGGTGEVWMGRHVETDGVAAVKILRAHRTKALHRLLFAREAQVVARLSHPHIVRLFEVGPEHLATAFIDGSDLQRRIGGGIDPATALRIAVQIGSALAYAHAEGVVHRDVKPGNILIDHNGNAFLTDFGLAQLRDDLESESVVGGTPAFMAPEQAMGVVSAAADQYSLARTIVEMLVGGAVGQPIDEALHQMSPSLGELRRILEVATQPRPESRWSSVAEMVRRLQAETLPEAAPAVRRAPERRVLAFYDWAARAAGAVEVSPSVARADFLLSEIEAAGGFSAEKCRAFRATTGHADFGWSLYLRTDRLGPVAPSALARAGELVVLMHGWANTRACWHDIALAICRDNAEAVVLVPDVAGFGESTWGAPSPEQLLPPGLGATVVRWLTLLGLDELPGALVGHSMSGIALSTLDPDALGQRTTRVLITPAIFELVPFKRFLARLGARILWWAGRWPWLHRLLTRLSRLSFAAPGLGKELRDKMAAQFDGVPARLLSQITRGLTDLQLGPRALKNAEIIVGAHDPTWPRGVGGADLGRYGFDAHRVHVMASGGHYPHLPDADHPEWTARNQDELVRVISSVLLSCVEGQVASTIATPSSSSP